MEEGQRTVGMNDNWLREQTSRLFIMANDARETGKHELADPLTLAACRCKDRLNEAEGKTPPRSPIPSEPQQPAPQQQQQIQLDKE